MMVFLMIVRCGRLMMVVFRMTILAFSMPGCPATADMDGPAPTGIASAAGTPAINPKNTIAQVIERTFMATSLSGCRRSAKRPAGSNGSLIRKVYCRLLQVNIYLNQSKPSITERRPL
jgi:hypothetical protein